jgi:hypothetical protein
MSFLEKHGGRSHGFQYANIYVESIKAVDAKAIKERGRLFFFGNDFDAYSRHCLDWEMNI